MFSLIISIIAVALVVGLAVATLFYGSKGWTENNAKAEAAKYRNEAMQITGALSMYKANEGSIPENFDLEDLAPRYLKAIPEGDWSVDAVKNRIFRTGLSEAQCLAANESVGYTFLMTDPDAANYSPSTTKPNQGVPFCDWDGIDEGVPCCFSS